MNRDEALKLLGIKTAVGLTKNAVERAYKICAQTLHPDKHPKVSLDYLREKQKKGEHLTADELLELEKNQAVVTEHEKANINFKRLLSAKDCLLQVCDSPRLASPKEQTRQEEQCREQDHHSAENYLSQFEQLSGIRIPDSARKEFTYELYMCFRSVKASARDEQFSQVLDNALANRLNRHEWFVKTENLVELLKRAFTWPSQTLFSGLIRFYWASKEDKSRGYTPVPLKDRSLKDQEAVLAEIEQMDEALKLRILAAKPETVIPLELGRPLTLADIPLIAESKLSKDLVAELVKRAVRLDMLKDGLVDSLLAYVQADDLYIYRIAIVRAVLATPDVDPLRHVWAFLGKYISSGRELIAYVELGYTAQASDFQRIESPEVIGLIDANENFAVAQAAWKHFFLKAQSESDHQLLLALAHRGVGLDDFSEINRRFSPEVAETLRVEQEMFIARALLEEQVDPVIMRAALERKVAVCAQLESRIEMGDIKTIEKCGRAAASKNDADPLSVFMFTKDPHSSSGFFGRSDKTSEKFKRLTSKQPAFTAR